MTKIRGFHKILLYLAPQTAPPLLFALDDLSIYESKQLPTNSVKFTFQYQNEPISSTFTQWLLLSRPCVCGCVFQPCCKGVPLLKESFDDVIPLENYWVAAPPPRREQRLSLLGLIIPHCSFVSEVGRESGVHMPATHLVGLSHPGKKTDEFRPKIEYYRN